MELRFDFADDDSTTGFRLQKFELYNWGTYDKQVVSFALDKHNALLTGDIGSGKSTIVDALTTLLVPHQKITFNKAAGAESKERSLKSYVLGEYKSAQDETLKNAKAVALRDETSFSVLLARFENEGYGESYTVAQFFYITNKQLHKFFITSRGSLEIKKDFIDTHYKDVRGLKKILRNLPHTEVYENFKEYAKNFKRAMGIKNDQALNLFYQTVSLKSIGNLTSFVREHMLESSEIDTKIDELCKNFSELNHAHNLVLRAKEQIALLKPIDTEAKNYEKLLADKEESRKMRDTLHTYFSMFKKALVATKIEELSLEVIKTESAKKRINERLKELQDTNIKLQIELQKNGGNRIEQLKEEKQRSEETLKVKKEAHANYNRLINSIGFPTVSNEHRFLKNRQEIETYLADQDQSTVALQNELMRNNYSLKNYQQTLKEIETELLYLENNRSNIPKKISTIRDAMAKSLGLAPEKLPFVGELLKVKDRAWQGAIERVLHNFSLSLLVDEEYYERVSEYVNATHLGGKLVYLKVIHSKRGKEFYETAKNSLLSKVEVKANTHFFTTINQMLKERFDISCVDSLTEFRKYKKALTKSGQFKSNYARHEKDDRFNIDDKRRWTLGWDNAEKLATLQADKINLLEKIEFASEAITSVEKNLRDLEEKRDKYKEVLFYKEFTMLDWYSLAQKIEEIKMALEELEKSSDILKSINQQLQDVQTEIGELKPKSETYSEKLGDLKGRLKELRQEQKDLETLQGIEPRYKILLDEIYAKTVQEKLTLINIARKEKILREVLQNSIDKFTKQIDSSTSKLLQSMNIYTNRFTVESQEFDASIESLKDFRAKLLELQRDDLPQFELRFKELFKEKTIQKTAMIQAELEHHSKEIESKIEKINSSLEAIEYNSGTYITLVAEPSNIKEIREFKADLKSAISYAISDDNSYDEAKFLQIKEIIDRFNGREGKSEIDKRWRALVTDVRNWFNFSASERYVSDKSEKEYYAHSGGKSGGQKEKLAYTVLASSLAFQFGLEHNKVRSRSFRFVMIDEAFGKGSDESTKYALRLFEKLNLQLLVITPKTKINVIEPFVNSVHFVHNQDGMRSSLLSMNIEEYQKNKRAH